MFKRPRSEQPDLFEFRLEVEAANLLKQAEGGRAYPEGTSS
jgi:hypothetical protein